MGLIDAGITAGVDLRKAAKHFYSTGEILWMGPFREKLANVPARQDWDSMALVGLIMDLRDLQRNLTIKYMADSRFPNLSVNDFLRTNPRDMDRYLQVLKRIRVDEEMEIAKASVAVRMLLQLYSNIK